LAAGLRPDPLGELTALPDPSWINGVGPRAGGGEKEWGKRRREGEGIFASVK